MPRHTIRLSSNSIEPNVSLRARPSGSIHTSETRKHCDAPAKSVERARQTRRRSIDGGQVAAGHWRRCVGREPMARGGAGRHLEQDRRALLRRRHALSEDLRCQPRPTDGPEQDQGRPEASHSVTRRRTMMTAIRTRVIVSTVAVVIALLTGCASNKGPAEAALATAQSAVDSVVAEESK